MYNSSPHTSAEVEPREALLRAAKALFSRHGFDGVTVREIAAAAGVHFSLIRYHFGDKQGLYRACILQFGQARLQSARRLLTRPASREDFIGKLEAALDDIVAIQLADPELTMLVLREVEAPEPLADDVLGSTLIEMAKHFIKFFESARRAGYLRRDADPQFITHALQGIINHFVRTDAVRARYFSYSISDETTRRRMLHQMHRLVLQGILQVEAE